MESNGRVPIFCVGCNNIKDAETDKMIPQFHVGSMYMPFSRPNKTFREQVKKIFTARFYTKSSHAIKKIFKRIILVLFS